MEIMIPSAGAGMEFDFNSARSSPHPSAPSSPKRFGQYYYTSAPSSPSRISEFYHEFDSLYVMNGTTATSSSSVIPFGWEEKPGTPKSPKEEDFAFNFSADMEQASLTAEELFDDGKIRPLKPPPRLQAVASDEYGRPLLSPRSPKSPNPFSQGKKLIRDVFSPRTKNKKRNPFAENTQHERGRQRINDFSSGSRRATRSLSPYRVSEYPWEEEEEKIHQQQQQQQHHQQQQQQQRQQQQQPIKQSSINSKPPPAPAPAAPPSSTKSSSRKWRFTDFLLFRSASEGRAADKDPLRKYSGFKRSEDIRNTSSRSTEGSGSGRRKGQVSAHELHYTKNKAAAQDLKKKTFLPYKSGILGFHGLGSFSRS